MRRLALVLAALLPACLGGRFDLRAPAASPAAPSPAAEGPSLPAVPEQVAPAPAAPEPAEPEPLPLPTPEPPPPAVDLSDPLELLWSHRLEFAPGGEPQVTIGLMEGQREIAFRPRAAGRVVLRGGGVVEFPAGVRLSVRARNATPARLSWLAVTADQPVGGREGLLARRDALAGKGIATRVRITGAVYGIAGRVVDNRREQLVVDGDGSEADARAKVDALRARGVAANLQQEVAGRPAGTLILLGPGGAPLGLADTALMVAVEGDEGFVVELVEHNLGPSERAREDRSYRGRLYITLDAQGGLTAVHGVPLEELLRGIVPSEMPGGSPVEALKAQAVTARSNVLSQIGVRHLGDPFMLCAEVHCQAYRGDGARTPRTDEAVGSTRGEAIFGRADRRLVDGVYSAMCGGHGEDNDAVWDGPASPSLRGRPDLPPAEAARWAHGLGDDATLRAFLKAKTQAYCQIPTARRDRFRWERRLDAARLGELGAALGIGRVRAIRVEARGASGRARTVRVEGERGVVELAPELHIRRALGDLPSAMFVVDPEGDGLVLRGGGWGHGAGLCQWGAVGRAMSGQDYQEILRAYFSGAEVAKIY